MIQRSAAAANAMMGRPGGRHWPCNPRSLTGHLNLTVPPPRAPQVLAIIIMALAAAALTDSLPATGAFRSSCSSSHSGV